MSDSSTSSTTSNETAGAAGGVVPPPPTPAPAPATGGGGKVTIDFDAIKKDISSSIIPGGDAPFAVTAVFWLGILSAALSTIRPYVGDYKITFSTFFGSLTNLVGGVFLAIAASQIILQLVKIARK